MKVVYNACYGGFSLSEAGMRRYCEIKGIPVWVEHDKKFAALGLATYWIVPPEQRPESLEGEAWYSAPIEERKAYNEAYRAAHINDRDIPRHDPALVQVVEELGDAASGRCAKLRIEEIPDKTQYRIDEYDGMESVETRDSYEWVQP